MFGGLPDLYNLLMLMRLQCEGVFVCDSILDQALQQMSSIKEYILCSSLSLIVSLFKLARVFV